MADLPSFTVEGNLNTIPGVVEEGELQKLPAHAVALFTHNLDPGVPVNWDGEMHTVDSVEAKFSSTTGELVAKFGGGPVLLLAEDAGLGVEGIQWTAHITVFGKSGQRKLHPIVFDAAADGETVDLGEQVTQDTAAKQATAQASLDAAVGKYAEAFINYGTLPSVDGGSPSDPGEFTLDGGAP